jgi:putative oxygen-independent coproporphyrinogen III oxidase
MNTKNQTAVYIHVPYCERKCGYCAFNSEPLSDAATLGRYLDAVAAEIDRRAPELVAASVRTVYFGGGTPSLAPPERLAALLDQVCEVAGAVDLIETTIEVNPGTADYHKLHALRQAGFDRLSLGVQSFSPAVLAFLQTKRDPVVAEKMVETARRVGFTNLSLDLIVGLPAPHSDAWRADVDRLIKLAPAHVSVYQLTYEEGTALFAGLANRDFTALDPDEEADVLLAVSERLRHAGYEHYEVSSFAQPGFRSRHNSHYWTGEPYLGFGAGAHSLLERASLWTRCANLDDPAAYVAAIAARRRPIDFEEALTPDMAARERIMLHLRTSDGLALADFPDQAEGLGQRLGPLVRDGLYTWDGARFRPTPAGLLVADGVAELLWELFEE